MNLELKFDKMAIDTSKAEDFFKERKGFSGINYETTNDIVRDDVGNEIYLSGPKQFDVKNDEVPKPKLMQLVKLIEENEELFCQLEYMTRHVSPVDVKNYDLQLIKQNILYCVSSTYEPDDYEPRFATVHMNNDSPLACLGYTAQLVMKTGRVSITAQPNTAAVCSLFADLCKRAGFGGSVCLQYISGHVPNDAFKQTILNEYKTGCFGVITAKSDIDSAVDTLIDTPNRLPWRVKRILVQENVLQRFQSSLECKAKSDSRLNIDEVLIGKCSNVYICEGKVFFVDFAGTESELGEVSNAIIVEAYRTVKELISLLQKSEPFCVSLWSESVSESNEIAHKIKSKIVWTNCFGHFNGPPKSSQSFYTRVSVAGDKHWQQLPVAERVKKINNALTMKPDVHDFIDNLEMYNHFSLIENVTCVVMQEKHGVKEVQWTDDVRSLLVFLALGGNLVVKENDKNNLPSDVSFILDVLQKQGLPVKSINGTYVRSLYSTARVIWTSYGTIFAN